jgi:DNA-binding winged helix-turn-helix (wHTH) protein
VNISSSPARVARFGVFELDTRTGELRKRGIRVHLQEQPFEVLALLIERAGDLVTRDELKRRVWSDSVFVGFDQALNNAVAKIRLTLGDSAESPRFVETLERRGYRFIASVGWSAEGRLAPAVKPDTMPEGRATVVRLTTDSHTIALTGGTHIIGRDPAAAVWLDSSVVSRHHARIVVSDGRVTAEDLGSRNGTFVNGVRLAHVSPLAHGDELRIGTVPLVVHVSSGKTPTRTVADAGSH